MSGAICVYWLYAAERIGTFGNEIFIKRSQSQLKSLRDIRRRKRGVVWLWAGTLFGKFEASHTMITQFTVASCAYYFSEAEEGSRHARLGLGNGVA